MPEDAPWRFQRPAVLRVGSFADWPELSSMMSPHFESAAQLADGSPIAAQARAIMAQTSDPLARAALATQLVQDEVSYLLNGLDGGNYLPQRAEDTWEKRFGDCKAKSVLLLSLLREMGIESEVVLVSSRAGDMVAELLPLPASFDHMIVHAVIGGQDYWLDGTSAATRIANVADVPPFHHALPLRSGGAELMPMVPRDPALPQVAMAIAADQTAGIDFPALMTLDVTLTGPGGAQMRALADNQTPEALRQMARSLGGNMAGLQVSEVTVAYDAVTATATIHAEGVAPSAFQLTDGRPAMILNTMQHFGEFNPDRARAAWRDIPVMTPGPGRRVETTRMLLPGGGASFALVGEPVLDSGFGNLSIKASAAIEGGTLVYCAMNLTQRLGEISPADLPEAKRAARRLAGYSVKLTPSAMSPGAGIWTLRHAPAVLRRSLPPMTGQSPSRTSKISRPCKPGPEFNATIFDFAAAKADYDRLIERNPSAWAYRQRSAMQEAMGDDGGCIADLRAAYDLEPFNSLAFSMARCWPT